MAQRHRRRGGRQSVKLWNHEGTDEQFRVTAHCRTVRSKAPLLLRLDAVGLEQREAITAPYQEVAATFEAPPGEHEFEVDLPELGPESSVELRLDWLIPPAHRDFSRAARRLRRLLASGEGEPYALTLGSVVFTG